jgi:hypothetical protein
MTVGTTTVPTAGYCSTHRLKWQLDPTALLNNNRRLLLKFLDLAFIFGKLEKIYFFRKLAILSYTRSNAEAELRLGPPRPRP